MAKTGDSIIGCMKWKKLSEGRGVLSPVIQKEIEGSNGWKLASPATH